MFLRHQYDAVIHIHLVEPVSQQGGWVIRYPFIYDYRQLATTEAVQCQMDD